ncbi:MAG: AmmeMemoRadiSam system radical SAM enzyme [Victivallaceae bacterium]|nr:AmmeMemoRadiSam system radical SAM enzyme [Victivallaceae bacterium]
MDTNNTAHLARWWKSLDDAKVQCGLCPRACRIADGKTGFCGVRKNIGGKLYSLSYGMPVALHVDPIEKKPLAEFLPGTKTFSLGTFGCTLDCSFCQNASLSRGSYTGAAYENYLAPERVVELALDNNCRSVAFTYNEPTVFAEYAIDIAELAHKRDLKTVLVTNGYITEQAAADLYPVIDAANVDMKGFSEEFYRSMTASHLNPVLNAIRYFYELEKHIEITNLVIPGKNDSMDMIDAWLDWVEENLDKKAPLHFSAFFPTHKYYGSPRTPRETLWKIKEHAAERGFTSVYLGNI